MTLLVEGSTLKTDKCWHGCRATGNLKHNQCNLGLPWWLTGNYLPTMQETACQCWRSGFDPWVEKIPWRRKWHPTLVFLPGKFHGWRSLACFSPWDHKELDTTKHTCKIWSVLLMEILKYFFH